MTRDTLPFPVADLSAFTKALSRQLVTSAMPPSHLTLMNMLARANGFRNVQHLRAAAKAQQRLDAPEAPALVDHSAVARALNHFDPAAALIRWPSRRSVQILCLWGLWSGLPRFSGWTERATSTALDALHHFGDAALLRRDMVHLGLLSRGPGGTDYARTEQPPPPEARDLIARLSARRKPPLLRA